ncbi:MAG: ankyrin repeat domain-containing protein [Myxococcota bacterium]|nr:ankyrin repeat domain-containing protein [Myxococcota bacterium]
MIRRIFGFSESQKPPKAPEQLHAQPLASQPAGPRYSIAPMDTPAPSGRVVSHRTVTCAIPSYPILTDAPTYGGGLKLVTSTMVLQSPQRFSLREPRPSGYGDPVGQPRHYYQPKVSQVSDHSYQPPTMVTSVHGPQPSSLLPSLDCGQDENRMPPYAPGYDDHGMPLPSAPPLPLSADAKHPPKGQRPQTVAAENHKPVAPETTTETSTKTRPSLAEVKAVFSLARHGKYHQLAEALDAGRIAVSSKDRFGNTLLHIAAQNGFAQNGKRVLKTILRRCTALDLNAQNNQGQTPLHFAYAYKYTDCAIYLVSKGASKMLRNRDGLLPREGLRAKA